MSPSLLEKLVAIESSLSCGRGDFALFGVFLREESPGKWDLIVAAPWLLPDRRESFQVIADAMRAALETEELLEFSRVVILEPSNPFLQGVLAMATADRRLTELLDTTIAGISLRRGWIITARGGRPRARRRARDRSPTA